LTFEDYDNLKQNYSEYEYEVLANAIGSKYFEHVNSKTQSILKAEYLYSNNETDCVQINAYSFRSEPRVDFVPVLGRDGYWHNVPVPWEEYIPVLNISKMAIKRVGLTKGEFDSKKPNLMNTLFNKPNAYYHGLFAKILENNETDFVDKALQNI
jgi:hypothetical protein